MKTIYNVLIFFLMLFQPVFAQETKTFLFVGSYTDGKKATGIRVYEFNQINGDLALVEKEENLINVSFIALDPKGKSLYAATEARLKTPGYVSAFKIDSVSGQLTFLNKQSTGGKNPVHLAVDKRGTYLISSNYTEPLIGMFQCKKDGSLSPILQSLEFEGNSIIVPNQNGAHLHSSNFDPSNTYVFSPDLGSDKIRAFSLDTIKNRLVVEEDLTVVTKQGAGPRHFTFHPSGKFAYCAEELNGTVTAYKYANGLLEPIDTYFAYSKESEGIYSSADIHVSPDGFFVYVSNRLKDEHTIAIFSINQETGELNLIAHQDTMGHVPRSFVMDPTGKFLLVGNLASGTIVVFKRDLQTGLLSYTGNKIEVDLPSSLKMKTYNN